jgi:monoamine oxidase
VLATPLPPLRRVSFSPPLPAPLDRAVAELQYGVGTKTVLQYERRFWLAAGFSGATETDLDVFGTWDATEAQHGRSGILMAYTMGAGGRRFTALPDAARIRAAADQLETIYPGSRALLRSTATVAWANEPYTGGTYTAFAPGQMTRFWRALRRPYGRIHLAGEHTSAYSGYMEGAVRSGQRVAAAIARARR